MLKVNGDGRRVARVALAVLTTAVCGMGSGMEAVGQPIAPRALITQCASLAPIGPGGEPKGDAISEALGVARDQDAADKARVAMVGRLAESCSVRAVQPLIRLLRDPSLAVRVAAIEGLGRLGDPEAIDFLAEQALDESVEIRLALIGTLSSFRQQKAKSTVLNSIAHPGGKTIEREDELRVRGIAILTLNQLIDNTYCYKAITFLHDFGDTTSPSLLAIVDEIFAALPQTRNGTREMIGILKRHSSPMMRIWMAQRLGKLRVVEARDALAEVAAGDRDAKVKTEAEAALKMIDEAAKK